MTTQKLDRDFVRLSQPHWKIHELDCFINKNMSYYGLSNTKTPPES